MMGSPESLQDPKWYTPQAQSDPELKEEFEQIFYPWILSRSKEQAWAEAQGARVLSAPLNTMEDLAAEPFFNARGVFDQVDNPEAGSMKQPGRPFKMSETPSPGSRPAPILGQHNQEVFTHLGYTSQEIACLREMGVI